MLQFVALSRGSGSGTTLAGVVRLPRPQECHRLLGIGLIVSVVPHAIAVSARSSSLNTSIRQDTTHVLLSETTRAPEKRAHHG